MDVESESDMSDVWMGLAFGYPQLLRLLHVGTRATCVPCLHHVLCPALWPMPLRARARTVAHVCFVSCARTVVPPPHPRACRQAQ
jgi:hypothetical protein